MTEERYGNHVRMGGCDSEKRQVGVCHGVHGKIAFGEVDALLRT